MGNEHAFLWCLVVLAAFGVAVQLMAGRVIVGFRGFTGWSYIERDTDPRRFWLFIVGESLAVLVLIGQAATFQ